MKNKKGFTLVELLAVVAILGVIVIIALPNVLGMFNSAKKNSFETEVKNIYKTAQQQWVSDSLFNSEEQVYSRCSTCTGKSLDLTGRKELEYYIKLNKSGQVVEYYVTDGTYQFSHDGDLLLTNIEGVETVADLEDTDLVTIVNDRGFKGEAPKLIETIEQATEGELSPGDEIVIGGKEHFNVVSSDSQQTVLLAKYNLYVGYVMNFTNEAGYSVGRKIESSESGYGWQSSVTANDKTGVVAFSGQNYWQDPTRPAYFKSEYPDARNESIYNPNLRGELIPVETKPYTQTQIIATENDYGIGLYVEDYISKIRSLGVNVISGNLLSNNQATSLGCSGNSSCPYNRNLWLKNTSFWVASVAWMGATNQNAIKTVSKNGSYTFEPYNMISSYGVRPTITVNTSDIGLLPHLYFENKPVYYN